MFARVNSCCLQGIDGRIVEAEAFLSGGMPAFDIVGLPDTAVKEAKERVRAAIKSCGMEFPSRRIVVNLAPADIKKEGPVFDLPIAIALLMASGYFQAEVQNTIILGELSLSGMIRPINGILALVSDCAAKGFTSFLVPPENGQEAALVSGVNIFAPKNLYEAIEHLNGHSPLSPVTADVQAFLSRAAQYPLDFSEVKGQEQIKRALEIAAAGGHNCLIMGSPGSGKSMLAQRIPTILPEMTYDEAMEVTKIHSIAGLLPQATPMLNTRPFRSPHHSISAAGLVGGGANAQPGELSLAHNGVLFLDEFTEFRRDALETMRQPLEDGRITISRVAATNTYPSRIMLVAALNPCRCGYFGDPIKKCSCSSSSVSRYLSRISGPLLDRIDIQVEAVRLKYDELRRSVPECSADIRARVNSARRIQSERYEGAGIHCNAMLEGNLMEHYCRLGNEESEMLNTAFSRLQLSARAYSKILKVSRTIADLDGAQNIDSLHIAEAIQYRSLDRRI